MAQQQNSSKDLYDLLVSRGWDPEGSDDKGQPSNPNDSLVFTFDYIAQSGKNYGTAVTVFNDGEMQLFYGDNLGSGMDDNDKDEWFQFLQQLKKFAVRHDFSTFSPRNLNQLKHTMAGMAAIKEGLFEGYYGSRKISYAGKPTEARLMIKHSKEIHEHDARYRYIDSLFIETAEGERWKMPFRNLAGGRAMLEHIKNGGRPYDVRGVHISELVTEVNTLSRFRRATHGRIVEGVAQSLIEQAIHYLTQARNTLKSLAHKRGYQEYFESWSPADISNSEALVEEVKNLFIETTLDARIEAALPILSKIKETSVVESRETKNVDVDAVLSVLRQTISRLNSEGGWSNEAKSEFEHVYSCTRRELMHDGWPAASDYLQSIGANNPDLFDAFVGAMWDTAGLPETASWSDFEHAMGNTVNESQRLRGSTMKEANIFENWVKVLGEGTWAMPTSPEDLRKFKEVMQQEIPIGPDATNAIEVIYDILGDDILFDLLQDIAEEDPDADARPAIYLRAQELGVDVTDILNPFVGLSSDDKNDAKNIVQKHQKTSKKDDKKLHESMQYSDLEFHKEINRLQELIRK